MATAQAPIPSDDPAAERRAGTDRRSRDPAAEPFTVVVPCYNESGGIRQTIEHLHASLGAAANGDGHPPLDYRLLVVDDGSTDGSGGILDDLAAGDPLLDVHHHDFNQGYGAALKTGIRRAETDLIVITDADGTYPNEQIPHLVRLAGRAEMVVGARILPGGVTYPLIRKVPKVFLRAWASWLVGQPIPDLNSGMRVFRRRTAERFIKMLPDTFSFTTTITMCLMRNRHVVRFEPIGYTARIGKSKIKPVRDTLRFLQLILRTGMYFAPMRVLSPVILALGAAAVASFAYDVVTRDNIADKTVLLSLFTLNTAMFGLLADMIDKRSAS